MSISLSENRQQLPPLMIEYITKKLNDNAVCEELDTIGLTRPRTAKVRKTLLQSYLIENFTSVNMSDRNEEFRLEKSRMKSKKKKARRNTGKSFHTKNSILREKPCEATEENTDCQLPCQKRHQHVHPGTKAVESKEIPVIAAEVKKDGIGDLSDENRIIPQTNSRAEERPLPQQPVNRMGKEVTNRRPMPKKTKFVKKRLQQQIKTLSLLLTVVRHLQIAPKERMFPQKTWATMNQKKNRQSYTLRQVHKLQEQQEHLIRTSSFTENVSLSMTTFSTNLTGPNLAVVLRSARIELSRLTILFREEASFQKSVA